MNNEERPTNRDYAKTSLVTGSISAMAMLIHIIVVMAGQAGLSFLFFMAAILFGVFALGMGVGGLVKGQRKGMATGGLLLGLAPIIEVIVAVCRHA